MLHIGDHHIGHPVCPGFHDQVVYLAGAVDQTGNLLIVLQPQTSGGEIVSIKLHADHIVIPHIVPHSIHDFVDNPHPVFQTPAVCVCSLIAVRGKEGTQQIVAV